MNLPDLTPTGQIARVARGVAMGAVILVVVAGMLTLAKCAADPLGLNASRLDRAEATSTVNGQQAASNAAGAAVNDRRASNVANINNTVQEARHALWQEDDLDAALSGYLADLDRVRDQGRAPVTDGRVDGRRSTADAEPGQAGDPDPSPGRQP